MQFSIWIKQSVQNALIMVFCINCKMVSKGTVAKCTLYLLISMNRTANLITLVDSFQRIIPRNAISLGNDCISINTYLKIVKKYQNV